MLAALAGWLATVAGAGEAPAAAQIPPQHLPAYFEARPERFLVDPQGLLPPDERRERERFLEYHAGDSAIDFHVLLFGAGQVIPQDIRSEELAERFFSDGKAALLALYFLGRPEETALQLSPGLAEVVVPAELARLRKQAVQAASARVGEAGQLEEFCVQMTIGIFWIERQAGLIKDAESAQAPGPGKIPPSPLPARERWLVLLETWWREWGVPASLIVGVVLTAAIARVVLRRRARYRFPDDLPPPRLGGHRGAGTGALIEFRSSTRSPSSQKGEPDDSLGGL